MVWPFVNRLHYRKKYEQTNFNNISNKTKLFNLFFRKTKILTIFLFAGQEATEKLHKTRKRKK